MALLNGKKCLVLGGEDGLGGAIASVFRAEGAQVCVAGPDGDVAFSGNPDDIEALTADTARRFGGLDVLVGARLSWDVMAPDAWDAQRFSRLANANGALAASLGAAALKHLRSPGAVCLLGSDWALASSPETGLSGAAQAAIAPLTKALALRGAPRQIRANALYLGLIDNPATRALSQARATAAGLSEDVFARGVARIPMGRAGTPQEVGRTAAFLASDRARHITGVTVLVDGGLLYA